MASSATHLTLAGPRLEVDTIHEKLGEYLRALEEERTKVEAFKRELPLCLSLIDEAIESAKQRAMEDQCSPTTSLQTSDRSKGTPVLENFMPLKRRWENTSKESKSCHSSDEHEQRHELVLGRPAWSGEAQLWTQQSPEHEKAPRGTKGNVEFGEAATDTMASSRLQLSSKHRQGGAFVPFIRERHSPESAAPPAGVSPVNAKPTSEARLANVGAYDHGSSDHARMMASQSQTKIQSQRKTRRCWSPELHRRFVSALQQLGGSQVATPKQIRELMKVDTLTNDEVKSHLQKYRLHTRRPSPSPSSSNASAQAPQLVVLGWMRPDQFQAAVGAAASQASAGGGVVCDGPPPLVVAHKYAPPQSTSLEQPPVEPTAPSPKHLPAVSTSHSSLPGRSSVTGGSPNSSSDSYVEEADHDMSIQERKLKLEPQQLQLQQARESKGSTTSLVDFGTNTHTTSRKTMKAAA